MSKNYKQGSGDQTNRLDQDGQRLGVEDGQRLGVEDGQRLEVKDKSRIKKTENLSVWRRKKIASVLSISMTPYTTSH